MRGVRLVVGAVIGVAIILWLLQFTGAGKVLNIILGADLTYVVLAAGLFIAASVLVSFALFIPLKQWGRDPSLGKVIMASFGGQLLGDVTPARSGYFVTPIILNQLDNIPLDSGATSVVTTGAVNFFAKAVLSSVSLAYFATFLPLASSLDDALILGVLISIAAGLGLSLLIWTEHLGKVLERLGRIGPLTGVLNRLEFLRRVRKEGQRVKRFIPQMAVLIVLSMITNGAALFAISVALHYSLPFLDLVFIGSIVSALMYIPITIAGLGVQETGYVVFLSLLGMPLGTATAFALIARFLFTGTDIIGIQSLLKMRFTAQAEEKKPTTPEPAQLEQRD